MSPRPSLADERRPQILRAACHAIAKFGYDRVRLVDVARSAGVGIGVVQHYFGSRDELLLEAFWFANERSIATWDAIASDRSAHPWQRLRARVEFCTSNNPEWGELWDMWFELWPVSHRDPNLRAASEAIYDRWRIPLLQAIADGVEQGLFDLQISPDDIVETLVGLIDGLGIQRQLGHARMPVERMRRMLVRQLARDLGYAPGLADGEAAAGDEGESAPDGAEEAPSNASSSRSASMASTRSADRSRS